MKKITAIVIQQKNPNRVNIHLDGEFAFGLARITAAWLRVGQELDQKKIEKLQAEDAKERALQQALLFLNYRARSESEVRKNLKKHEIPEVVIDEILDRLRKDRLVDDGQFAQAWVENRNTFRPRSRRLLTMELRQKGVEDEAIESALEEVDDEALAYQAAQKRVTRFNGLEEEEFRKKLSGFLVRRGFSYSVIAPVVSRIWNESNVEAQNFEEEDIT